jgi:hypothetical protein
MVDVIVPKFRTDNFPKKASYHKWQVFPDARPRVPCGP